MFEYRVISTGRLQPSDIERMLNKYGEQGFKLVTNTGDTNSNLVMEKQVSSQPQPTTNYSTGDDWSKPI